MPTYLVLKKVHSMPVSEFSKDSLWVSWVLRRKYKI
jgi:hypothetical protein